MVTLQIPIIPVSKWSCGTRISANPGTTAENQLEEIQGDHPVLGVQARPRRGRTAGGDGVGVAALEKFHFGCRFPHFCEFSTAEPRRFPFFSRVPRSGHRFSKKTSEYAFGPSVWRGAVLLRGVNTGERPTEGEYFKKFEFKLQLKLKMASKSKSETRFPYTLGGGCMPKVVLDFQLGTIYMVNMYVFGRNTTKNRKFTPQIRVL